jgi:hypothetical protein
MLASQQAQGREIEEQASSRLKHAVQLTQRQVFIRKARIVQNIARNSDIEAVTAKGDIQQGTLPDILQAALLAKVDGRFAEIESLGIGKSSIAQSSQYAAGATPGVQYGRIALLRFAESEHCEYSAA